MAQQKKETTQEVDKTEVASEDTFKLRLQDAKEAPPVLVVISGRPLGKSFPLVKEENVLGRDLTADISLPEGAVSRKHTAFVVGENGVTVKDMGSTNGTFVNDQKLGQDQPLTDGDLVRCGNTILKFCEQGQIENVHHARMYDLATRDDLTGAYNKKTLLDLLREEFERSKARSTALSLVFFDLDHFKKVNDTHGHLAGDAVLKETSHLIINKMIRQQDALGRYGGEEFALILRETPLEIAVEVSERLRSTVEAHQYTYQNQTIPITISIGVATMDSTTKKFEDLLANADKAVYDAKTQGRNRVCVR